MSSEVRNVQTARSIQTVLLICGIVAIPVYAGTDILAGTVYPGYSFTDQAVSELFAIDAPTSSFVVPLFSAYSLIVLAFAFGILMSSNGRFPLRVVALLLIANAINGLALWNFFPMHMRGTEITFVDTMHVVLAAVGAVFGTLAVGFGAFAFGKRFKFYSISTIVMLFAPAIVGFSYVPQVAANDSSPWLGLLERLAFAVHMQWQIALAIVILRKTKHDMKGSHEKIMRPT